MDSQGYLSNAHSIIGGFLVFLCTVLDMDSQGYLSNAHRSLVAFLFFYVPF